MIPVSHDARDLELIVQDVVAVAGGVVPRAPDVSSCENAPKSRPDGI